MTESEAKMKWCPMVRSPRIESREPIIVVAVNRPDSAVGVECIASACMMWRWDSDKASRKFQRCEDQTRITKPNFRPASVPKDWTWESHWPGTGWYEPVEQAFKRRNGHCGLGGAP